MMLSPIEQSFIDDIITARYPDVVPEPQAAPVQIAMGGAGGAQAKGPESVGEFVSDVAAPLGAMVDMGAATAKGMAQGFAGLPGDLEGLTRTVINLLGGKVDENTKLPTTEEIKGWLDQFPITRVGGGTNPYEKLGEFAAPGGQVVAAKKVAKPVMSGASKVIKAGAEAGKSIAPKVGEAVENYLTKTGAILKFGPEGKNIEVPVAPKLNTPAFKNWFGRSKVVDANGKPLVVYHGTNKSEGGEAFTSFDTYASNYGLMGQGSYFTDNTDVASSYTAKGRGDSPTVYPMFLSIKNPIDMDAKADAEAWIRQFPDAQDFHSGGDTNESWYRAAEEALQYEEIPMYEGAEIMQDGLRAMGFDGITHIGGGRVSSDGVKHRVFIAFDPSQIKSVFNKGTFDPNDPRILYGAGGAAGMAVKDKENK